MCRNAHFYDIHRHLLQDWEYPRKNLIYLKELGEGEFGKVLLMKAQVGTIILIVAVSLTHVTIHYTNEALFVYTVTHPKPLFVLRRLMYVLSKPHCPCILYRGLPTSVEKFQLPLKLFPSRINTFLRNLWKRLT